MGIHQSQQPAGKFLIVFVRVEMRGALEWRACTRHQRLEPCLSLCAQNPKDKRKLILDEKLRTIFSGTVTMFSMNKQVGCFGRHVFRINGTGSDPPLTTLRTPPFYGALS